MRMHILIMMFNISLNKVNINGGVACHRTGAVWPEPRYRVSRNRLAPAIKLSLNFHTALQNVRFRKEAIYTLTISGATPLPLSISLLSCYPLIGRHACHISILFMVFLCLVFSSPCPGARSSTSSVSPTASLLPPWPQQNPRKQSDHCLSY